MKHISNGYCCERCGAIIKGKYEFNWGRIVHPKQCSSYEVEE